VHRDIKPENLMIDVDDLKTIYMIDFGLAKRFVDFTNTHIKQVQKKGLVGTQRYASINSHDGLELGRRDDLISLAYVLIYFCKGRLPWQVIKDCDQFSIN
jgi:serine/threonine protein kinase